MRAMKIKSIIPKPIRRAIKGLEARVKMATSAAQYSLLGTHTTDYKQIPIIINNFNRLDYLQRLIASLESRGYTNIYIIDNCSTYPPLLEYYKLTPYKVFRLKRNIGYRALWKSDIYNHFKRSYYVYTDVDMEIDPMCPDNFMERFVEVMERYPRCQKVGFGIRIDDLPECYRNRQQVVKWESQFWRNEIEAGLFRAQIDTTFALYRPFCKGVASAYHLTFRTGFPYVIRHLPWYVDSANLSDEERYYLNSVRSSTHWSALSKR